MNSTWQASVNIEQLSAGELAAALEAASISCTWETQAAVGLIVAQGSWLSRSEFRRAVEVDFDEDGRLCAWVTWSEVDLTAPASAGELRILEIARSLGGVPSCRPLSDLLSGLDEHNLARVLQAMEAAAHGRQRSLW